jgi:hypothetical protein
MIEINQMALSYFRSQFPSSWGQPYLADRFGQDLTDDLRFQPGQAPAGWTGLVNHLRSRGLTGEEMTAAGVATVASTGRLIDRFRDRVIFPIIHNGDVHGFVGRRELSVGNGGCPRFPVADHDPGVGQGPERVDVRAFVGRPSVVESNGSRPPTSNGHHRCGRESDAPIDGARSHPTASTESSKLPLASHGFAVGVDPTERRNRRGQKIV